MTYIEKVMQAVKFDKELLDLTEQSLAYFVERSASPAERDIAACRT